MSTHKKIKRNITIVILVLLLLIGIILVLTLPTIKNVNILSRLFSPAKKDYICAQCNVILVSLDTLRADELPCYGYHRNTAPNLCAYAQKNILFANAYSHSPYTLSSHFSIFTSLYPSSHHMLAAYRDNLNPDILTLPQILKAQGYETMYIGVTDDPNLPLDRGLERGFDHIQKSDRKMNEWDIGYRKLLENITLKKPLFLFFHTYAVHDPYLPGKSQSRMFTNDSIPAIPVSPEEYETVTPELLNYVRENLKQRQSNKTISTATQRVQSLYRDLMHATSFEESKKIFQAFPDNEKESYYQALYALYAQQNLFDARKVAYFRALYDERIYQMDEKLSGLFALLQNQQVADNTIVIITSDHGEEFNEHGKMFHMNNIYNTSTYTPLIMHAPKLPPRQINDLVQSIDIVPTILGMLNVSKPVWFQGIDLLDVILANRRAETNTYLYSEFGEGVVVSIRDKRWKLYARPQEQSSPIELYDLTTDPLELHNVADVNQGIVQRLTRQLSRMPRANFPKTNTTFPEWIDAEKRKKLMKEGYF